MIEDCATSTASGERVERGKAAEIASPSCVHGIGGRSDVFEAGLCIFYGGLKAPNPSQATFSIYMCNHSCLYNVAGEKRVSKTLMSLIRKVMHLGRKK